MQIKTYKDKQIDYIKIGIEKIEFKKRCLLCKYADLDLQEDVLICGNKNNEAVEEDSYCNSFRLCNESREDIIDGIISAV